MTRLRVLASRLAGLMRRARADREVAEEIETHLQMLTDEHLARGLPAHEARLAARRAFGGVDQVTAAYRDQRGVPWVETLFQDAGFGLRLLARDRGFAATAILVLALGIGVNNLFFTLVYAHTLRGLPVPQSERVLYVSSLNDRGADRPLTLAEFEALEAAESLATLVAYTTAPVTLGDEGRTPERFDANYVSSAAFEVTGAQPVLGPGFDAREHRPGASPALLLSVRAWRSRYASDPGVVGRTIRVNGRAAIVAGVMPDGAGFPNTADVWIPLAQREESAAPSTATRALRVFGRVAGGASVADARAEIDTIFTRLEREQPDTNRGVRARVIPLDERFLGRLEGPWLAFITAGCIIVLISAANVANLMLARGAARAREFGIRTSLGASRARLIRQLLVEGVALALLGGAAGLGVSVAGVRLFRSGIPDNVLPYWLHYDIDGRVVAALVGVALAMVLVFALIPALHASKLDVTKVLKDGGRSSAGRPGARRWTVAFLAVELALAVMLLAQVGLVAVMSRPTTPSDDAVRTRAVVTASLTLPGARYPAADDRVRFYRQLTDRLRTEPGIAAASLASALPMAGGTDREVVIEGRPPAAGAAPTATVVAIAPGYFEALALPVLRGRPLGWEDGRPGVVRVIVNESFTRVFLGGIDPLSARLAMREGSAPDGGSEWMLVAGVAPDIRQRPAPDPVPVIYVPLADTAPPTVSLLVRSAVSAAPSAERLREITMAIDPDVPLFRLQTLATAVDEAQWNGRVSERLAVALTLLSVLLATVGLYAVTAHAVGLRAHEIGIRMALGARRLDVVRVVLASVRLPLVLGFVLGVGGSMAWDRAFSSGRAGLRASDPEALAFIGLALAIITAIACTVPARRASRLDPVEALRQE